MFAFYVSLSGPIVQTSYYKDGKHVPFYFHELVQHKLSFMNFFYIKLHLYVCLLYVSLSGPIVQTSYHKGGKHVTFYFHELVHHKLSFMNFHTSNSTSMFAFYLCVHHKRSNCQNLISQSWQACGLLFS